MFNYPNYYINRPIPSQPIITTPQLHYNPNLQIINNKISFDEYKNKFKHYPVNIYKQTPNYNTVKSQIISHNKYDDIPENLNEIYNYSSSRMNNLAQSYAFSQNYQTPYTNYYKTPLPPIITPYNIITRSIPTPMPIIPDSFMHKYNFAKPIFGSSLKGPNIPFRDYSNNFGLKVHNEPNFYQAPSRDTILPSIQGHNHPTFGGDHFLAFAMAMLKQMDRNEKKNVDLLKDTLKRQEEEMEKLREKERKRRKKKKDKKKKEKDKDEEESSEESEKKKDLGVGKTKPKKLKDIELIHDWWHLCRDFVNIYIFISTAKKYSNYAKIRNRIIEDRSKAIVKEFAILKDWIIAVEEPLWKELKIMDDLDLYFTNIDSSSKIKIQSQKINALIQKYIENLISKCSKLNDIPDKVLEILYEYIKDNGYFAKNYLNTFQVNRLDFGFYGNTRKLNNEQSGMLLSFLIISGITVQSLFLHLKEIFKDEFNKRINTNILVVGSVLHYINVNAFKDNPTQNREPSILFNYYRNYHIFNEQLEKQHDVLNSNALFLDNDEMGDYLIPENKINRYWEFNEQFSSSIESFIHLWGCKLAKAIKNRYSINDPNLKVKKKLEAPSTKKFTKDSSDSENNENEEEEDD